MFGFGKKHRKAVSPETEQPVSPEASSAPTTVDAQSGEARTTPPSSRVQQELSETPRHSPRAEPERSPSDAGPDSGPESTAPEPKARRMSWFRSKRQSAEDQPGEKLAPSVTQDARPIGTRSDAPVRPPAPVADVGEPTEKRSGVFSRLRERLSRTRETLGDGLGTLFVGRKRIDDDLMEELETLLLTADVGVPTTSRIMEDLASRVKRKSLADPQALLVALKAELRAILKAADAPVRQPAPGRPQVVLMVGVNGAGKTTTIGKLAKRLQDEGNSVILAAGDTFRAAAVEQLQTWGERNRVSVVAQQSGADSASVIFDALQAATARGADVLIADTAGRLHTKSNLMDELSKVSRVMKKIDPDAPHEVMLVVDATTGQNALTQAVHFHQAVGLTGITLTKLDGTAKGGILFAIADRLKVPIRFIGVGETIDDLRPFDPDEFLDALLS
jgi:fused signal recognition particle receptor